MIRLNKKIKHAMLALGVCGLTLSTAAVASFCSLPGLISNDYASSNCLDSIGGVTLNNPLTLMNGFENISGASYDSVRVEVGVGSYAPKLFGITEDLAENLTTLFTTTNISRYFSGGRY